jgi:hypothetical protein
MNDRIRVSSKVGALLAVTLLAGPAAFAVPSGTATFTTSTTPALRINEVLASNTANRNGTSSDLIELYNAGSTPIDLTGKVLVDQSADPTNPVRFVFPAGATIGAGGYLVVFADSGTGGGVYHTGFSLDAEGDEVKLYDSVAAASAGAPVDSIKFGFQVGDFSLSRTGAAGNVWALTTPTLGAANGGPVNLGSVASVKINEWAGKINYRLDHDMIELYSPEASPVALGGVGLTDNTSNRKKFAFPALSFIGVGDKGYLPLYGADFVFGLDNDRETITLSGENNEQIDQVTLVSQPADRSSGRSPDGSANIVDFAVPTPGFSNTTPLPPAYNDLLNNLRITEVMYDPAAESNASQFEFIELQNIGSTTLDLAGVRFTNGIEYEFPAGTTLAAGAFIVVVNDRSSFLSRYGAGLQAVMAPGGFNGSLSNDGETLALTLPTPWKVHILRFRYDPAWYRSTSGQGYSLVPVSPFTSSQIAWQSSGGWRASAAVNGSPGAADPGTPAGSGNARLANLSVRTTMAAGQNLIVGFFVGGGARNILVRAAGPGLTALGLSGAMTDPRLDLYSGTTLVLSNEDWSSELSPVFASVAAFPFPAGSRDAAFQQTINGEASVHARGTGPGIVLVEAYDTGGAAGARMVNVSARNRVGTGDDVLIAGFNISGTGAKQLLIRAVGPKLASFGVTDVLNDPKLEVYASGGTTPLIENDNWAASLSATFTAVGAFPLDANSRDAALLTTLQTGSYTVLVRGADGGTGEALVEVYELP